jgi:hypothetical protein
VVRALAVAAAALLLCMAAAPARADWSGDTKADVLAVDPDGRLLMYRGTGAGAFVPGGGLPIGTGWGSFTALLAPGDWSGDGKPDLLARTSEGALLMYRGNGRGGFATGTAETIGPSGWQPFTALLTPRDFSGDGKRDLLARDAAGALFLYRGNGRGGFITGQREPIGTGWGSFTALLAPGDWSGDGRPDLLARTSEGALLMYRGNGRGGFVTGQAETIGPSGWQGFTALIAGGDFSGDGRQDLVARDADGLLFMYRGNGRGGFVTGQREQIGTGWNSLSSLTLVWDPVTAALAPVPAPPAPPSAAIPDGSARIRVTRGCTRPGGRLKVRVGIRRRAGRKPPRVLFVVFFVRGGSKRVDHRRPFVVRLRMNQRAGKRGRVRARVYFRRAGSKKLRSTTVSKRFRMCKRTSTAH